MRQHRGRFEVADLTVAPTDSLLSQMRRHWITSFLAWLCLATAAAEIYRLGVSLFGSHTGSSAPLYAAVWRLLGLFPVPTVILWPVSVIIGYISPAILSSKAYLAISSLLTIVISVLLGVAILRMQRWARAALIAICALTIADQLDALYALGSFSPRFLTVLQSNFEGAWAGYISGNGSGSILGSLIIAIVLLRLLIRNGLPCVATVKEQGAASPTTHTEPVRHIGDRSKAHQLLLFATAAVTLVQLFLVLGGLPQGGQESAKIRLLFSLLLVPNLLILVRCWRSPDRLSLGLAAGYGLLIGYIGAIFLPAFLFGLIWMPDSPRNAGILQYLALELAPALQLTAGISAIVVTRSLPDLPARSARIGAWGTAFLIPLVVGTAMPQFYMDWQRGSLPVPGVKSSGDEYHELMKQDAAARDLVRKYGYCAFLYAKLHPEAGFPETAALMGPGGSGCLNADEAAGHPQRYSFRYEAQRPERSARFNHFTAAVQMNHQRQVAGVLMDEKGVLMFVRSQGGQSEFVTADQLSWNAPGLYKSTWGGMMPPTLRRIVACATMLRDQSASKEFPAALVDVLRVKLNPYDRDCINIYPGVDPYLQAAANSNRAAYGGNVLEYVPQPDASGKLAHIVVTFRPEHYGLDGVRSYLIDDSGARHATSEDRSATTDDPAPLSCEGEKELCEDPTTP